MDGRINVANEGMNGNRKGSMQKIKGVVLTSSISLRMGRVVANGRIYVFWPKITFQAYDVTVNDFFDGFVLNSDDGLICRNGSITAFLKGGIFKKSFNEAGLPWETLTKIICL